MRTDGVQMYPVGRHQKKVTRLVGMPFTLAPHRVRAEVAASFQDICHLKERMLVFPYRKLIVLSQENLHLLIQIFLPHSRILHDYSTKVQFFSFRPF